MRAKRARGKVYYGVYADGKKEDATGTGPRKHIRGLAAAISHPGIGVGRSVCVVEFHTGKRVDCYERGRRVRP